LGGDGDGKKKKSQARKEGQEKPEQKLKMLVYIVLEGVEGEAGQDKRGEQLGGENWAPNKTPFFLIFRGFRPLVEEQPKTKVEERY